MSLIGDAANRFPNPDFRSFMCIPEDPCFELNFIAFIDNVTFHPVPEPSPWLLLSLGIAGVVMIRRKLASRA